MSEGWRQASPVSPANDPEVKPSLAANAVTAIVLLLIVVACLASALVMR